MNTGKFWARSTGRATMASMARRRSAPSPWPFVAVGVVLVGGALAGVAAVATTPRRAGQGPRRVPPPAAGAPPPPPPPQPSAPPRPGINKEVVARIAQHAALIDQIAKEVGVPASELRGVIAAESGGKADSGAGGTGYKGLMQAGRDKAELDPAVSIRHGAKKLREVTASLQKIASAAGISFEDLGRWTRLRWLLRAYNAGPGTVEKALAYAGNDAERWMEAEPYQRALIYHGAYSTQHYAPRGTNKDQIEEAERWRKKLEKQDLTLAQVRAQGAPALVLTAIQKKWENTRAYVEKALAYVRYYEEARA